MGIEVGNFIEGGGGGGKRKRVAVFMGAVLKGLGNYERE